MPADSILFDVSQLNPEAGKAIDRAASELLSLGVESKVTLKTEGGPFPSRRESKGTITVSDIIGEPVISSTNLAGQINGRLYIHDGVEVMLEGDDYKSLRRVADLTKKHRPYSSGLSSQFIEETIFFWWRDTKKGTIEQSLSSYLSDAAVGAVHEREILIPLSCLEVESQFHFGDVTVEPLQHDWFNNCAEEACKVSPDYADQIRASLGQTRAEIGHLAAVAVTVVGEGHFVNDRARTISFDMASMLRFMCPAAPTWNIAFPCYPKGCEHVRSIKYISMEGDRIVSLEDATLDGHYFNWKLSIAELETYMKEGFANAHAFFKSEPLWDFARRVKTAIFSYSEGVASFETINRLISTMSALEHLLLRDGKEQIQSGVGDRIAFLIGADVESRRAIVANFKDAYGIRSQQVHHLSGVADEDVLQRFFINAWLTIRQALRVMPKYKTKEEFLDALDAIKYS
jgi:hypothetical protein